MDGSLPRTNQSSDVRLIFAAGQNASLFLSRLHCYSYFALSQSSITPLCIPLQTTHKMLQSIGGSVSLLAVSALASEMAFASSISCSSTPPLVSLIQSRKSQTFTPTAEKDNSLGRPPRNIVSFQSHFFRTKEGTLCSHISPATFCPGCPVQTI